LWALQKEQGGTRSLAELVDDHAGADAALAATPDAQSVAAYQAPYQRFLHHLDAVRPLYAG